MASNPANVLQDLVNLGAAGMKLNQDFGLINLNLAGKMVQLTPQEQADVIAFWTALQAFVLDAWGYSLPNLPAFPTVTP